jgi:GNAT superfamily N-acetyltransferase
MTVVSLSSPDWREVEPLIAESEREGFRFLARLRAEHASGAARFGGPGEALLGVYADGALVAVGGVCADRYEPGERVGRIRHVYVARAHRRQGAGRLLLAALIDVARPRFYVLTLRTDTAAAARFYEALGWTPVPDHPHHTHRRHLADA